MNNAGSIIWMCAGDGLLLIIASSQLQKKTLDIELNIYAFDIYSKL